MVTYKIDEVAKQCGLTKRTIRYYEEIGLLPSPQRSEGNMRLYTQEDVDLLKKNCECQGSAWFLPARASALHVRCGNAQGSAGGIS